MTSVWLFKPRSHGRKKEGSNSLRNKRPDLSGRPPCKGVAIGAKTAECKFNVGHASWRPQVKSRSERARLS